MLKATDQPPSSLYGVAVRCEGYPDNDREIRCEATDMKGYAIVHGRKISFELSKGLAAAHRRNARQALSAAEAITKVEERRRVRAIKHASPYVEACR